MRFEGWLARGTPGTVLYLDETLRRSARKVSCYQATQNSKQVKLPSVQSLALWFIYQTWHLVLLCFFFWMECVVPKYRNRTGEANLDVLQCSHAFVYISLCEFMMSSGKKKALMVLWKYILMYSQMYLIYVVVN